MTQDQVFDALRETLWTTSVISAPLLGIALIMGVVIGLFQALTSIQEATLTFVPKIGAMVVVFWMTISFMTTTLADFFQNEIIPLIEGSA